MSTVLPVLCGTARLLSPVRQHACSVRPGTSGQVNLFCASLVNQAAEKKQA
uniref:Uncharacterized protein n=1 Tax=Anguilla anguilla TaxID=7936 RepID=A0A0E9XJT7_ANGAN